MSNINNYETLWLIFGFAGQGFFGIRFFLQWLKSEKEQKSIIPDTFWYFSIAGGISLFAYAVHKGDPVFMLGNFLGIFVYSRNLYFVRKAKKRLPLTELAKS
jgi:lipid-A-disaccharide synthase-like uncharacterized protein